jgi:DNA-binding GntR family transcriptional regulator
MVQRLRPQPHLVKLHTVLRISFDDTISEHRAIIDAIREGSADMAAKAMERHLIRSCARLRPGTAEAGRPCGRRAAGNCMPEESDGVCCGSAD